MKLTSIASAVVLTTGLFVAACSSGTSPGDALKTTTDKAKTKLNSPNGTFNESQAGTLAQKASATQSSGLGGLSSGLSSGLGGALGGGSSATPAVPEGASEAFQGLVIRSLDVLARGEDSASSGMSCAGAQQVMQGTDGSGECSCGQNMNGKIVFEGKNVSALKNLKTTGSEFSPANLPTSSLVVYYDCEGSQQGATFKFKGGAAMQTAPNTLIVGIDMDVSASAQGQSFSAQVSFAMAYENGDFRVLVETEKGKFVVVGTGKYNNGSGTVTFRDASGTTTCEFENGQKKSCTKG